MAGGTGLLPTRLSCRGDSTPAALPASRVLVIAVVAAGACACARVQVGTRVCVCLNVGCMSPSAAGRGGNEAFPASWCHCHGNKGPEREGQP